MGRKKTVAAPGTLTAPRAARLYKMLNLLKDGPQTRRMLLSRLKLDVRAFYRDYETVRGLGITITATPDSRYLLVGSLDDALARLPFPDPGLNVRDALLLASGSTHAHRKLRQRVTGFLAGTPTKPR